MLTDHTLRQCNALAKYEVNLSMVYIAMQTDGIIIARNLILIGILLIKAYALLARKAFCLGPTTLWLTRTKFEYAVVKDQYQYHYCLLYQVDAIQDTIFCSKKLTFLSIAK